jgi:hypothetical protein
MAHAAEEIKDDVVLDDEGNPIEPEVIDGEPIVDDPPEPELDDEGNPIVKEVPAFMADDDDDDVVVPGKTMPVSSHVKVKEKYKGKIEKKDDEIALLRKEIETLKSPAATPATQLARPNRDDFDTDEEYEKKYEEFVLNSVMEKVDLKSQGTQQQVAAKEALQKTQEAVESHYERVDKLVEEFTISPEVVQKADQAVREAVDAVTSKMPNVKADAVVDHLISTLDEGSERAMLYVGRSQKRLAELQSRLLNDPTGMSAAVYMGEMKREAQGTRKKTSTAPKPAAQVKSSESTSEKGFKRKYDEAHKKKNTQAAFNIKREAKAAGVDTSNWIN